MFRTFFNKLFSDPKCDKNVSLNKRMNHEISIPLPLTDELLLYILSFVPADDLLNNCIWIKEWEPLIESQSLWLYKCEHDSKPLPVTKPDPLPEHFYRSIYFVPYGTNLLLNPSGHDGLKHWKLLGDPGELLGHPGEFDGDSSNWCIEKPPQGIDPPPGIDPIAGVNSNTETFVPSSCFVSSYTWCANEQCVDLLKAVGGFPQILDNLKPSIEISEWVGTRFDCGSIYRLEVKLENENGEILDEFDFEHRETVMLGQWKHVKHIFSGYPAGVRLLRFRHSGKDTQFWAGNYGCKTTEAGVAFVLEKPTKKK